MTISLEWIERLCRALNVPPDALFTESCIVNAEAIILIADARAFQVQVQAFKERLDRFVEQVSG